MVSIPGRLVVAFVALRRRERAEKPSTESGFSRPPDLRPRSHFEMSPSCPKGAEAQH
jgi:hypothetical protein